jgi:hypothetical protein
LDALSIQTGSGRTQQDRLDDHRDDQRAFDSASNAPSRLLTLISAGHPALQSQSTQVSMDLALTAVLPGVLAGRTRTDGVAVVGGAAAFGPATQHGRWTERRRGDH